MSQATCPGVIATGPTGEALCEDVGGAPLAWTVTPVFSIDALDPLLMSGAFSAGFIIVATGMVIGIGFRTVLRMLK